MREEEIKKIIFPLLKQLAPETEPSQLTMDENIRESLNLDSFDALQFIVALSEKLDMDIPEQDYGKTTTLRNLIAYIEMKKK